MWDDLTAKGNIRKHVKKESTLLKQLQHSSTAASRREEDHKGEILSKRGSTGSNTNWADDVTVETAPFNKRFPSLNHQHLFPDKLVNDKLLEKILGPADQLVQYQSLNELATSVRAHLVPAAKCRRAQTFLGFQPTDVISQPAPTLCR